MDINTRLDRLDGEIAELAKEIREEKTKLETAEGDKATDLRKSLERLHEKETALMTQRGLLLTALVAAPAPGKNPPSPSTSAPPPCMRTPFHSVFVQQPPLVCLVFFTPSRCVC